MKISNMRNLEVEKLRWRLKRSVNLCKAITRNMESILAIKEALKNDLPYASQLLH